MMLKMEIDIVVDPEPVHYLGYFYCLSHCLTNPCVIKCFEICHCKVKTGILK
jgi:hypothetical protein